MIERIRSIKSKEIKIQEPFVIRARDLPHYADAVKHPEPYWDAFKETLSPEKAAENMITSDGFDIWSRDAAEAKEKLQQNFEIFSNLPDDYPVEIVEEGISDNISKILADKNDYYSQTLPHLKEHEKLNEAVKTIREHKLPVTKKGNRKAITTSGALRLALAEIKIAKLTISE